MNAQSVDLSGWTCQSLTYQLNQTTGFLSDWVSERLRDQVGEQRLRPFRHPPHASLKTSDKDPVSLLSAVKLLSMPLRSFELHQVASLSRRRPRPVGVRLPYGTPKHSITYEISAFRRTSRNVHQANARPCEFPVEVFLQPCFVRSASIRDKSERSVHGDSQR